MENFHKKTLVTRRSLTYTYYVSPSGESTKQHPALLFVHGFPDSAHLWTGVVEALSGLPNKFIIPDCLGYAGTDKPEDTSAYHCKGQADDLADILGAENTESTVIIGHDWGSLIAQRTYLYHRELFSAIVIANVAYAIPSGNRFDLKLVNAYTEKLLGRPTLAYWEFFTTPDAPSVMDANPERLWQALHGDREDWMNEMFCKHGAMRAFLLGDEDVPVKEYAGRHGWKERFLAQFKADGFASTMQMYKSMAFNVQYESDLEVIKAGLVIDVPVLFLGCTRDAVCLIQAIVPARDGGYLPHLKEVTIDSGHWSPMEKTEEFAGHIEAFLVENSL